MNVNDNMASGSLDAKITKGPKGTDIPIIASSLVMDVRALLMPGSTIINKEMFLAAIDEFKECGFNGFIAHIQCYLKDSFETGSSLNKLIDTVLECAESKGVFVILTSNVFLPPTQAVLEEWKKEADKESSIDNKCKVYENKYKERIIGFIEACTSNHRQSFGGISLQGEPTMKELQRHFPSDKETKQLSDFDNENGLCYCVSHCYNIVKIMIPDNAILIVTLVGDNKMQSHFEDGMYNKYVGEFANIMLPDEGYPYLWSYDIYPITESNYLLLENYKIVKDNDITPVLKDNGKVSVNYQDFYKDLVLFHNMTHSKGSIFWNFVQSMEYMATSNYHPIAEEAYLRFAIFSSLAMGCQGIMYWTYHQRKNQAYELYLSAPLDRDGNRTPVWYYAKKINAEIKKFNSVFRNSSLEDWFNLSSFYSNDISLNNRMGPMTKIQIGDSGVLITRLKKSNTQYIIVVNYDVCNYQDVLIFFTAGKSVSELTKVGSDGRPNTNVVVSTGLKRTLSPGGYIIFSYKDVQIS